jgi:hypothetical protein
MELIITDLLNCGYMDISMLDILYSPLAEEIGLDSRVILQDAITMGNGMNGAITTAYNEITYAITERLTSLMEEYENSLDTDEEGNPIVELSQAPGVILSLKLQLFINVVAFVFSTPPVSPLLGTFPEKLHPFIYNVHPDATNIAPPSIDSLPLKCVLFILCRPVAVPAMLIAPPFLFRAVLEINLEPSTDKIEFVVT